MVAENPNYDGQVRIVKVEGDIPRYQAFNGDGNQLIAEAYASPGGEGYSLIFRQINGEEREFATYKQPRGIAQALETEIVSFAADYAERKGLRVINNSFIDRRTLRPSDDSLLI